MKAVEAGKVRLVGQFGTYGLTIVLEHGNGYYSVYSHLQSAAVKLGTTVAKGDEIGTVGGENSDYGPHLHFEIRGENQVALDPTVWLQEAVAAAPHSAVPIRSPDCSLPLRRARPRRARTGRPACVTAGWGYETMPALNTGAYPALERQRGEALLHPRHRAVGTVGRGLRQHDRELLVAVAHTKSGRRSSRRRRAPTSRR